LTSVGQPADREIKTTFDDDVCKITKDAMVVAHGKEGTLYMISGFGASISVASSELDAGVCHQTWVMHMGEKGMKVMLFKDKLSGLKSIDLDFCEDCVYEK